MILCAYVTSMLSTWTRKQYFTQTYISEDLIIASSHFDKQSTFTRNDCWRGKKIICHDDHQVSLWEQRTIFYMLVSSWKRVKSNIKIWHPTDKSTYSHINFKSLEGLSAATKVLYGIVLNWTCLCYFYSTSKFLMRSGQWSLLTENFAGKEPE